MLPVRIAFDMDGVLVDFERGIRERFHAEYPKKHLPEEEFKEWRESLFSKIDSIGPLFWESLPSMPKFQEMFSVAQEITDNIRFITAYPACWKDDARKRDCSIGKRTWILKNLSFENSLRVHMSYAHEKFHFCDPSRYFDVLIDDRESTIHEWRNAGGFAIHYKTADQAIDQLKDIQFLVAKENIHAHL